MIRSGTLSARRTTLLLSGAATMIAAQASQAAAQCTRGWTGTVNYSRTQASRDAKTVQRISGKGNDTTNWSLTSDYGAEIAVREAPDGEASIGRATVRMAALSTETKTSQDQMICPHTRTARAMSGSFVTKSEMRANGSGLESDVSVTMDNDGTYGVSVRIPEVRGMASGSESSTFSGQCTPKNGVNRDMPETPTTIDPVQFSSSGQDRVPPADPNRISGSHSATAYGVTETLRWNLRRCGNSLRLVDLKFEDMRFPTWNDWKAIDERHGTTDGNVVRMTAIVANDGGEEKAVVVKFRDTYKGDKWDGARRDGLLEERSLTVPAGVQREVRFEWDSSGYAWYDDGRPRLIQRIKAEVEASGKKADETTRNLKVAPKPLVLVHGLWSNWKAWESWQNILTTTHSYDWKAFPVGEESQHGRMNTGEELGNLGPTYTISENAEQLGRYVQYAQKKRNAWHVDLVAHSMGGLISRRYIHAAMPTNPNGKPQVAHLVMLGTPNMGSRCADLISAPLELNGRSMEALRELRPHVVEAFNAVHTNRKQVDFSILAGNPLPTACYMFDANDGVVAVPSAIWTIADSAQQSVLHTSMTDAAGFVSFVKPRVALGPGKQRGSGAGPAMKALTTTGSSARVGAAAAMKAASAPAPATAATATPAFAKIVQLAPGQKTTVPLAVAAARNFGVTFTGDRTISATLTDDKGVVVASSRAGSPEAGQLFRSLLVARPVTAGQWTLTLENSARIEREVVLSAGSNAQ